MHNGLDIFSPLEYHNTIRNSKNLFTKYPNSVRNKSKLLFTNN